MCWLQKTYFQEEKGSLYNKRDRIQLKKQLVCNMKPLTALNCSTRMNDKNGNQPVVFFPNTRVAVSYDTACPM